MADGIACCAACTSCAAAVIPGGGQEYEPGRHLAIIHVGHVGQLEAQGWTVWSNGMYDDGTPDVVCPHLAGEVQT